MKYLAQDALLALEADAEGKHPLTQFEEFTAKHQEHRWFDAGWFDKDLGVEYQYYCFKFPDRSVAILGEYEDFNHASSSDDPDAKRDFLIVGFGPWESDQVTRCHRSQFPGISLTNMLCVAVDQAGAMQ